MMRTILVTVILSTAALFAASVAHVSAAFEPPAVAAAVKQAGAGTTGTTGSSGGTGAAMLPSVAVPGPIAPPTPTATDFALRDYVLGAMNSWPHAVEEVPAVEYKKLAEDIATAAMMDAPAWSADVDRHRSGTLLAAIGYWEGARFAAYVDSGKCNDPEWRRTNKIVHYGDCDHGKAVGLGQVWPTGENLEGTNIPETKENVLADRVFAFRVILEKARRSIRAGVGLCHYSGEDPASEDGCPKADARLHFAERYWTKHPFQPTPTSVR